MNKTEFKKLMHLQHGFTARAVQGKTVFGWSNIRTSYSTVTVIDYEKHFLITCNVENEQGRVYYPFGETEIKINKADNALKATFTVTDDEGVFEDTASDVNSICFSSYFPDVAREYVKNLCELIFAVTNNE